MSIRSLAFFNRSPCAVSGDQADTDTVTAQGLHALTRHARNGDFYLAKNGDLDPATSGDFLTATDTISMRQGMRCHRQIRALPPVM
jgi:hypothetical protein